MTQDFVLVRCPQAWSADQVTFARVYDGQAFCNTCGKTDHERVKQ